MLKHVVRLLALVLASVLAACAGAPAASPTPTVMPTALPPDDSGSAAVAPTALMGMGGRLYAAQDLSIITTTGRPQFLNAYADW
jgi:hypothetical protein